MHLWRDAGNGPAVLLLHGFTLAGAIWEHSESVLSQRYRVLVPELPGHGGTVPFSSGDATMERVAGEVLGVMDRLGIASAAVAGHSMGGYVTLALYQLAPERVSGLALVNSQAGADTPEGRAGRFDLAERVEREGPEVLVTAMVPRLFAPGFSTDDPRYLAAAEMARQMPVKGVRSALMGLASRSDLLPRLGHITVPSLVLAGKLDQIIPADRAREMAAAIPDCALALVQGAGHMVMLEQPAIATSALSAWLQRVYPKNGTQEG